ncbi:fasciclin-3 isoform X1 [Athalia rosae]|uniref:fasciclin-3 isoform X1 n=1 Tax=Athalia rosae TaxID=37344 RepID=UPI002033B843|nr:fasciclin-3 isoform X1 [Athalia rosae]
MTMTSPRKQPSTMIIWACVAFLFTSVQAYKQNLVVDIEPAGQTAVRVGQNLTVLCRVGVPLQVCRVEVPGESSIILAPGQPAEDGIEYYGESLQAGQCGVRIAHIKEAHHGDFKCSLTPMGDRTESSRTMKIVVAKPPLNPELIVSPGRRGHRIYQKGEQLEISCRAVAGRPAANVSLYLDDEPIGNEEKPTVYDSNVDDNSLAVQNVSRVLDWFDNGKTLRCLASHIALDRPLRTTMQLEVQFAPQPQSTIERFGYVIGQPGIVNVTVQANPRPHFLWSINDEKINEGQPDESNRIETSTAVELGRGSWAVTLRIDSVQKSDTEKQYILEARNELGVHEYRIVLSTSTEPAGVDLDAGSIIGIVVGVLILLLIVFLIVFARATGRWCFAGGSSSRTIGESDLADPAASVSLLRFRKPKPDDSKAGRRSDTESAGRYSRSEVDSATSGRRRRPKITFSQLFKRNKDKVSGADTDTVRTVVTVDDEKIQTSEIPSAVTLSTANPAVGEGGIVYAELDLTQQKNVPPRRIDDDTTEYAEIIYTKPEAEEAATTGNK